MKYKEVQEIAKKTIDYIKSEIKVGMSLIEVREKCENKMLDLGADSFWYWDVGAFIFANDETSLSISGKSYNTSDKEINSNDIITIDLSPQNSNIWGDYARTIIIEDGIVVNNIKDIKNDEWRKGLTMEEMLHQELFDYATPNTSFEQLYFHMNDFIVSHGFINFDFLDNLGHSIVKNKADRIYIEKGNQCKLNKVNFFTFEPHIGTKNSVYGYKKENIYYFENDKLLEL